MTVQGEKGDKILWKIGDEAERGGTASLYGARHDLRTLRGETLEGHGAAAGTAWPTGTPTARGRIGPPP
jgi:hypothetical protein